MKKIDSGRLIEHIEEAQNWLDKAKTQYSGANQLRGELNLNLAQAEVRYAWELSRHQGVLMNNKPVAGRKRIYFIPAAAAGIIILSLIFGWQARKASFSPEIAHSKPLTGGVGLTKVEPAPTPDKSVLTVKPDLSAQTVGRRPEAALAVNQEPTPTVPAEEKILSPRPVSTVKLEVGTTRNTTSVIAEAAKKENNEADIAEIDPRVGVNQPKTQPVSNLTIDEEALTQEASRSLRNGK